ncbi:hypothetical protein Tco_0847495 [Tanacetum coccineum]
MHHSMCSSTFNLVFMTLVLSLWAIPLVVPLIPTFIANNLLTCHSDPLVVNSIGISPFTPTVFYGQIVTYLLHLLHFGAQAMYAVLPLFLPLDLLLLLILTISGSVFKLPLVLSLAFSKSADLFIHTFLELLLWTLILGNHDNSVIPTSSSDVHNQQRTQHSLVVGDDEGSAAANSVMTCLRDETGIFVPQMSLYSQLTGTGSSVGYSSRVGRARIVHRILLRGSINPPPD